MRKTHRKPPAIQTSRWHKGRRSRGRPERLLKPLRANSKRGRAARVRGAAVQRVGRPRPQEARGLQIPESTYNAPVKAALRGGLVHSVHFRHLAGKILAAGFPLSAQSGHHASRILQSNHGLVRLRAAEFDHLAPLFGFFGDEFSKICGRTLKQRCSELREPCL
jgi:hypothetical protein